MARNTRPLPGLLQELAPEQARFCLDIARRLEKSFSLCLHESRVLVAFSGGADSTALLLSLSYLAPKLGFTLQAAHLDHRLRASSATEAAMCGAFCDALGIPLVLGKSDIAALGGNGKMGIEEAAREARYAFYTEQAARLSCDWVAIGHTLNDLAEDVLMRLIRGAGWPGLSGMDAVDPERKVLRPLLLTSRHAVETFLDQLGVCWIEDESNQDLSYFRNRVRNTLLPLILKENPAFLEKVAGLWRLGQIDAEWFCSLLPQPQSLPGEHPRNAEGSEPEILFLPREKLQGMPKALRLRWFKKTLGSLGPGQARLDSLLALDAAFIAKSGTTEHKFPGKKLAVVTAQGIYWQKPE